MDIHASQCTRLASVFGFCAAISKRRLKVGLPKTPLKPIKCEGGKDNVKNTGKVTY
jgi:hypothetical protein